MTMHVPLFYKQKPLLAIDIGRSTVKVVQLNGKDKNVGVSGYGYVDFDPEAIKEGVIEKPEEIIKSLKPLLKKVVIGKLTTDRVASSIPTAHIFTRVVTLPEVDEADLASAIELEAEQYVPLPADQIYLDYTVIATPTKERNETVAIMVAAPKKIVDSYLALFTKLNLEIESIEPSLFAIMRAVNHAQPSDTAKVIIDFGSESSDLAIYDGNVQLTGTVATGGNHISEKIAETLGVEKEKAEEIKARCGIAKSKYQKKLAPALSPILSSLANEVQKMLRYHHDHTSSDKDISEIIIVGGGANLPGLSKFLNQLTGLDVSTCNPWDNITVKPLQPPHRLETTLYTTSVGMGLIETEKEIQL